MAQPSAADIGSIDKAIRGAVRVVEQLRKAPVTDAMHAKTLAAADRWLDLLREARREAIALVRGEPLDAPAPLGHAPPAAHAPEEAAPEAAELETEIHALLLREGSMPLPAIAQVLKVAVLHVRDAVALSDRLIAEQGEIRIAEDSTERLAYEFIRRVGPTRLQIIANSIGRDLPVVSASVRKSKRLARSGDGIVFVRSPGGAA